MQVIGRRVVRLDKTVSTMDEAARLADDGEPEGTVVIANEQTAGRGRHSREWISRPGDDLLLSVSLRPRAAIATEIQPLASLAITKVVESESGQTATIKWPNDVRVNEAKIAGILTEATQTAAGLSVALGIGLNVNSHAAQLSRIDAEATSLRALTGKEHNRADVLELLLDELNCLYSLALSGSTVIPAWREKLETIGQRVDITISPSSESPKVISGIAEDVDQFGRLMVRDDSGRLWPMSAGEVTLQRRPVES